MKTNIGIPGNDIEQTATLLNTLLADEYELYTKTKSAYWNVTGPNFDELHNFYKSQHEEMNLMIDGLAERIRSLGHFALGYLKDYLSVTHLIEDHYDLGNSRQITQTLFNDHETIIRFIRNEINPVSEEFRDLGTANFLTGLLEQHEKMAWRLRSFLS
jgi:starvation-inducible DNA-binding protein